MENLTILKFKNANEEIIYLSKDFQTGEFVLRFDDGKEERFIGHANLIWFNNNCNFKTNNDDDIKFLDLSFGLILQSNPVRYFLSED